MNETQAHQAVMVSLVVMLGYGLVSNKGTKITHYQQIWAIGVIGLLLSLISDVAPAVGGALAIVFSLGFIAGGQDKMNQVVINALGQKAGAPQLQQPQITGGAYATSTTIH